MKNRGGYCERFLVIKYWESQIRNAVQIAGARHIQLVDVVCKGDVFIENNNIRLRIGESKAREESDLLERGRNGLFTH